jgi:hypothetical protein
MHGTVKTTSRDYVVKAGTLTVAPGKTTKSVTMDVKVHEKRKAYETFYRDLIDDGSSFLLTEFRGIGTILDEDY